MSNQFFGCQTDFWGYSGPAGYCVGEEMFRLIAETHQTEDEGYFSSGRHTDELVSLLTQYFVVSTFSSP